MPNLLKTSDLAAKFFTTNDLNKPELSSLQSPPLSKSLPAFLNQQEEKLKENSFF